MKATDKLMKATDKFKMKNAENDLSRALEQIAFARQSDAENGEYTKECLTTARRYAEEAIKAIVAVEDRL